MMENIFIPVEADFRKWIREELNSFLLKLPQNKQLSEGDKEPLLSREEVIKMFKISFMTLNAWMNKGLPHYRQSRRVFFLKSEIMNFLKVNKKKTIF